MDGLNKYL